MNRDARRVSTLWMAATLAAIATCAPGGTACAQLAGWNTPYAPTLADAAAVGTALLPPSSQSAQKEARGPLARLLRNPDIANGLPPFALADQRGKIQRYVEPVDGIDLEPFIDQVVVVRHDTGRTLLASQLELPQQPSLSDARWAPLIASKQAELAPHESSYGRDSRTQLAQFADDDNTTVELLPEEEKQSTPTDAENTGSGLSAGNDPSTGSSTSVPGEIGTHLSEPEAGTMPAAPLVGPHVITPQADSWDYMEPCPECGDYHHSLECSPQFQPYGRARHRAKPSPTRMFADAELNFFRTHLNQNAIGKLSEKYEFSPRLIVGFRETGKLDARARYWYYDRDTRVLDGSPLNVEFHVLDLEGTHFFLGRRSELVLAAGLRLAAINLTDNDGDAAGTDLLGMTFAADGRTRLCSFEGGLFTWVYGGRLSILGGDWGGDAGSDFVNSLTQDDNVIVHELHAGIDYAFCYRDFDLHTRLGFEMQNWHSDVLAQNSIGILGPSFLIVAEF